MYSSIIAIYKTLGAFLFSVFALFGQVEPNNKSKTAKYAIIAVVLILTGAGHPNGAPLRIPFQLKRNVVIIPTQINGSDTLDLILDTGMGFDGVYLFKSRLLSSIDTSNVIEVRVPGAGSGEASKALMIEDGSVVMGESSVEHQRVIISTDSRTQNFPSDGIIGWTLLGHYVVSIDYDTQEITLSVAQEFGSPDSTWRGIPVTLRNNISFLEGAVEVVPRETTAVSLYVDLASGKPLELLTALDQKFTLPDSLTPSYLGTGLSGDIHGLLGHSRRLWLGGYELADVSTAFAPREVRSKQQGADGVLGNDCLRRFNVIFDYPHSRIWVKPNAAFSEPFEPLLPTVN